MLCTCFCSYPDVCVSFSRNASQVYLPSNISLLIVTGPVLFSDTGHYYQLFHATRDFNNALTTASSKTYNGLPGHLATITTQAELDFLSSVFPELHGVWIGASDSVAEGTFRWAAGPETGQIVNMTNGMWAPGEPSNGPADDCVVIWDQKLFHARNCSASYSYLVEYEGWLF